jgi:hypothetical protein
VLARFVGETLEESASAVAGGRWRPCRAEDQADFAKP